MENQLQTNYVSTNENQPQDRVQESQVFSPKEGEMVKGVLLSTKDVEEYRVYKRKKMVEEIMQAVAKSEAVLQDFSQLQQSCERAVRLKQAAIRLPLNKLPQARVMLGKNKVKLDCLVGGNGETMASVKAYEAKVALRHRAEEITVVINASLIAENKYEDIRKELRLVGGVVHNALFKVRVDKVYPSAVLSRLARLASEVGAKFFSVPYFSGCEKLRFDVINGCRLEVSDVDTLADFKKMVNSGVGRVVTANIWEIYDEWMREADKIEFAKPALLITEPAPSETESLPDSKIVQEDPLERKPTLAGAESTDLKFF